MNLEEVAGLSGVSRSTVSRVVNNDPNVSAATRAMVREIITEVNFEPNAAARSLAAGRTRILGLVIPMGVSALFTDPYVPLLIQGVSVACNTHDHSVMLWLAEPDYERRTIRKIISNTGLIDGVIVVASLTNDPLLEALLENGLPFVMVGRHLTNLQVSYVDVDNRHSARDAVTHLMRLGRGRVAMIAGPRTLIAGLDRMEGYFDAYHNRGLLPVPEWVIESDFTEAGGYQVMHKLLHYQPDAVFVASDLMAVGALRALHEAGYRVPEDVALVSFDDMPFAAHTDPPLTSVRQPAQRTGQAAAEMLIERIETHDAKPRRIILPTELIIRMSCGSEPA
jgi:LacI family transcriptional regulator